MALTVGLSPANLADAWLNTVRGGAAGSNFTAPSAIYVKLHTGIPGVGASNASSVTTRPAITFAAAGAVSTTEAIVSNGSAPSWSSWAGTSPETITHVSFWDASSGGNFLWSAALTVSKTMSTGDTLNLTVGSTTLSLTPIAAT